MQDVQRAAFYVKFPTETASHNQEDNQSIIYGKKTRRRAQAKQRHARSFREVAAWLLVIER